MAVTSPIEPETAEPTAAEFPAEPETTETVAVTAPIEPEITEPSATESPAEPETAETLTVTASIEPETAEPTATEPAAEPETAETLTVTATIEPETAEPAAAEPATEPETAEAAAVTAPVKRLPAKSTAAITPAVPAKDEKPAASSVSAVPPIKSETGPAPTVSAVPGKSAAKPKKAYNKSAGMTRMLVAVAVLLVLLAAQLAFNGSQSANLAGVSDYKPEETETAVIEAEAEPEVVEVPDEILFIEITRKETYLPFDGTQQFYTEIEVSGTVDETVVWSSSDESVASVTAYGLVTGLNNGTAVITATASNDMSDSSEVVVTDCIILPSYERKQFIPSYFYTEEEAELMDKILFSRVYDAGGYGTRGAVVAAARFITLEMPYMIPYFYENGRMDANPGRPICDGEGRYYHVGLYFSEKKFETIRKSVAGPSIWGAPLTNFQTEGYFVGGQRYPNGLSCSGFVSWAMINGGIDTGDIGAGNYDHIDREFYDIGERSRLTVEHLLSGEVRPGDLIGKDGHIAIVAGIDDTYIWIAESYFRGVQIVRFTINRGVLDCNEYDYTINMDHMYYGGDGVFENTWE